MAGIGDTVKASAETRRNPSPAYELVVVFERGTNTILAPVNKQRVKTTKPHSETVGMAPQEIAAQSSPE